MGEQRDAEWYDEAIRSSKSYHLQSEEAPWYKLWSRACKDIKEGDIVIDIGCGPGQTAELIQNRFEDVGYIGIDFSKYAISQAKLKCPNYHFRCTDILTVNYEECEGDVFLACEVLEHIDDDLLLLERIPSGKKIVITLPTFDDPGHVRYFTNVQDIVTRYYGQIAFKKVEQLGGHFYILGETK